MKRLIPILLLCVSALGQTAVPANFFGIHYNNSNSLYPPPSPLSFGTCRLWDTRTGWADLQSGASTYNFAQLGTWLSKFTNCKIIWTLAKTPNFIAANVSDANCGYTNALGSPNGSCTPPTDVNCDGTGTDAAFINFLTNAWTYIKANGYTGKITYVEIWNEWTGSKFWDLPYINSTLCSSTTNAAEKILTTLEQDARCVIKGTNCRSGVTYPVVGEEPAVLILSPPMAGPGHINDAIMTGGFEDKLLSAGAGNYADYLSIHSYMENKGNTGANCGAAPGNVGCMWPENVVSMVTQLNTLQAGYSLNLPIIISEGSWSGQSNTTDAQFEQAFVPRYLAIMAQYGVKEFGWYNVDGIGATLPSLYSNIATGALTTGGLAYQTTEQWLAGKTFSGNSCTVTAALSCSGGGSSNTYACPLTTGEKMVWYDEVADNASCSYTAVSGFKSYLTMDGRNVPIVGTSVTLDNRPILLEPTGDDQYCPNGTPVWGASDGPALLPFACYNTAMANTPANGATVNVSTAGQLTTALAAAACGQKITLQAGNVFSGNFTVPAVSCPSNNYLWIMTSGIASLPAEGARYSTTYNGFTVYAPQFGPCYAGVTSLPGRPALNCPGTPGTYTAKIVTPGTTPPLKFTAGTAGVRLIGLEITRTPGTGNVSPLILATNLGVSRIIFDRVWVHGDENQDETNVGLSVSADNYMAVIDSYWNNFYCISAIGACTDAHPFGGGLNNLNSTPETVFKVVNNFLEGAGQSSMQMGGGGSNTTVGDLEIRLNLMFKPLQWNPSDPSYNGGISGHPVIVKNGFELKNAQRVLFEGNQLVNDWGGFSQLGDMILLTPKNQASGLTNVCPNCFVSNVTIRYSTVNNARGIGQFVDVENDNGALSSGGKGWSVHDLVADNLMSSGCSGCGNNFEELEITENSLAGVGQTLSNVTVNHVTAVLASTAANTGHAIGLSGALISTGNQLQNIVFTNNLLATGIGTTNVVGGGITSNCAFGQSSGTNMINACWSPNTFGGNCFVNNGTVSWPGTNVTSVASYSAVFTNYNNGNAGNYVVAAGACKAAATDGLDPGANISLVASVIAGGSAPVASNPPAPATGLFATVSRNRPIRSFIGGTQ